jgi:phosphatidate cytidylyltransferase
MLKQRVITAVVLLALLLPALAIGNPWPFALLTLALIGAAGWEWGRLNGSGMAAAVVLGVATVVLCGTLLAAGLFDQPPPLLWQCGAIAWIVGGALALRGGPSGWPRVPAALRLALGIALLAVAWLALARAKVLGLNFLLSVFCLVWVADIAAYFGGRALGRRKLAPTISPGKSWEGVYSGMAGVLLLAVVWMQLDRHFALGSASLYTLLQQRMGWVVAALALALLAAMSVVGDLFESLVKRSAGAKDSSRLLPGHGGVLDRVDALLPVFPIALALVTL